MSLRSSNLKEDIDSEVRITADELLAPDVAQQGRNLLVQRVIADVKYDGKALYRVNHVKKPIQLKLECAGEFTGNTISGKMKAGFMGSFALSGSKV